MSLILKNKAVFLHIPKTGGNWITRVLRKLDLVDRRVSHKHADVEHFFSPVHPSRSEAIKYSIHNLFHPNETYPYMFCFVRNPLSWYESWFKYMSQPSRQWRDWGSKNDVFDWHPNALLNGVNSPDFNTFIRKMILNRPGYVSELYSLYVRPQVNFVGKQENLADDLVNILKQMNLSFDEDLVRNYEKVGVSPSAKTPIEWDRKLQKEVALHEYSGLVRYGYHETLNSLGIDIKSLA